MSVDVSGMKPVLQSNNTAPYVSPVRLTRPHINFFPSFFLFFLQITPPLFQPCMDYILGAVVLSLPPFSNRERRRMDASHFVMQHVQELGLIQNFNCALSPRSEEGAP